MTRYYHRSSFSFRFSSVQYLLFKIFPLTLFAAIAFFISSCEEGPTTIGTNTLPIGDFVDIKSTDTVSVRSYTVYDDSVRSDNPSYSFLGKVYDPYFGTTSAEFVSQVRLGSPWGGGIFTVDSIKLFMTFTDVKGDIASDMTLKISEIAEQLYTDSVYYSNKQISLTGYDVAEVQLPGLKADTINDIELTMPVEFGNYLMRDTAKLFHSNSKPDFRAFFKGLYFRISYASEPLFLTLSLAPPSTAGYYSNYFILYYHNETAVQKEFYFILDAATRNACFNRFTHDFNTADPNKKIKHVNDGFRDTLSYLQSLNGVYTKIKLPGIENIKNNPTLANIAVNKARLIIPVLIDGENYINSKLPSQLYLRYSTSTGSKYIVPDYTLSPSFFDGTLDTINEIYNFNVASYVQGYLEDTKNVIKPELEMILPSGSTKNVILKANSSSTPAKFEFVYTKF